jgi:hypothetical protein
VIYITDNLVRTLFLLHRGELNYTMRNNLTLEKRDFSVLALRTVTKMSLDVASAFNNRIHHYKTPSLSPNNLQTYLRAAQEVINLSQEEGTLEWHSNLDRARLSLKYLASRWKTGGESRRQT